MLQGKVYDACVQSCILHGSETWSWKRENELTVHQSQTEMRVIRWDGSVV